MAMLLGRWKFKVNLPAHRGVQQSTSVQMFQSELLAASAFQA